MTKTISVIKYGLLIVIVWFILHTLISLCIGLRDNVQSADVIVVFGNTVNTDGTPSKRLQARLDKAVELYNNNSGKYILVSGGFGKEGFDESQVMAEYLFIKGIPKEKVVLDPNGVNTQATVDNTVSILKDKNFNSVIVVSQYHHIPRILLTFRFVQDVQVYHAHANYWEARDIYSTVREFIAYYKYLFS
jgi:vancomycin permeability regulator SanA